MEINELEVNQTAIRLAQVPTQEAITQKIQAMNNSALTNPPLTCIMHTQDEKLDGKVSHSRQCTKYDHLYYIVHNMNATWSSNMNFSSSHWILHSLVVHNGKGNKHRPMEKWMNFCIWFYFISKPQYVPSCSYFLNIFLVFIEGGLLI